MNLDTFLLSAAMAALGLSSHVSAIRKAGVKPLLLAAVLFCWLIVGGAALNWLVFEFPPLHSFVPAGHPLNPA
jgi:uncharacterized membrane protein YadS